MSNGMERILLSYKFELCSAQEGEEGAILLQELLLPPPTLMQEGCDVCDIADVLGT